MEPAAKQFQLLYSGFSNPRDTVSLWAENGHVKRETACGPVSVIKVRATISWRSGLLVTEKLTTVSHEVGAQDVQGRPLLTKPAARPSYVSMAGRPSPSSHEPPNNGTRHLSHWLISGMVKGRGESGGKCTFQRLKEASGFQENAGSTWSWCKHGWPRLSHHTPPLLVVNCVKFHLTSKRSLPKFQTEMF